MRLIWDLFTSFVTFIVILGILILYTELLFVIFILIYAACCGLIAYYIIQSYYDEE